MLKAACPGGTFTHYDRKLHRADFAKRTSTAVTPAL